MTLIELRQLDKDRDKNVDVLFAIIEAAKIDHAESRLHKKKFSLRKYERELNEAYPNMDNKTALQTAVRTSRIKRGLSSGNATTIGGDDLYRVARFFLRNLNAYDWKNIKEAIQKAGSPFNKLLDVEISAVPGGGFDLEGLKSQRVGDLARPGEDLGEAIREVASRVDVLQSQLRLANSENYLLKRQDAKNKNKVQIALDAAAKIASAFEAETPEKQEKLKTQLEDLYKLLRSFQ